MSKVDLSVVIPCYNEEMIIERSYKEIKDILSLLKINCEIIFVDDKSTDATRDLIKKICSEDSSAKFVFHEKNQGRGEAVKTGFKAAQGDVAGFLDIDLSTPPVFIPECYSEILRGYDIVTALRIYKILELRKFPYNLLRLILHWGYRFLLKIFFSLPLKDTETGFKFFNREKIMPLINETISKHWFWDTEIMARAYFEGFKIKEIPSLYLRKPEHGSRVKIIKDVIYYFKKLIWFRKEIKKIKSAK